MRRLIIIILVLLGPTGCANFLQSGGWQSTFGADYGTYPENYVTIVQHWYGQHLKDPGAAKLIEITIPKQDTLIDPFKKKTAYGYSVCARLKGKNDSGRYSAIQKLLIREGEVIQYQSPKPVGSKGYVAPCSTKD